MKKLIFSILALAGFAACSTDSGLNETIAPEQKETFTIFAAQEDFDDTRVSISSDKDMHPTVLTWNEGDQINPATESGISVKLNAEEVNGKTAVFRTTQPVGYTKDDTYYACYPASHAISTTQLLYSIPATQNGLAKDAVVLYGEGDVDADTEGVQMNFKPVNAVLFVSVTDAPAEGFSKLEIRGYDNEQNLCGQATFDGTETDRSLAKGGTITINGSAANNNLKGVYVSLPGGVTFNTGYILTFTTVDGTVMSYGFNATEMKEGSINEAQVKWSTPAVTLGAKTTYSYASADPADPATANSMGGGAANGSGTTIFFNETYKSSFSNVQNAMIEDCGFIVDGTTYSAKAGQVTRNGKDFWMSDLKNQPKANHPVQAFIKIKHNANIVYSAAQTLSVTGIPYSVPDCTSKNFTEVPGWETTGTVEYWSGRGWQTFYYYNYWFSTSKEEGALFSPTFYTPANTNVDYTASMCYWTTGKSSGSTTIYSGVTTGKNAVTTNSKSLSHVYRVAGQAPKNDQYSNISHTVSIPKGNTYRIYISDAHGKKDNSAENWVCMRSFEVKYKE